MRGKFCGAVIFAVAVLFLIRYGSNVAAAPTAQNPTPTDEPTKRPYVFPTPIFIPTFLSATDLPPRGATRTPPPAAPAATTQPPAVTRAPAAFTTTPTRENVAAFIEDTETPTPEPESDTAGLAQAAEQALLAMSAVIFLGFVVISGTAFMVYRRSQREERIAAIKARLKSK